MPQVSFPTRCAVAVICGEHLVSQVYPASIPVEVFLDNAIELLSEDLKRRGAVGLDEEVAHEFQRPNGSRLDAQRTLDDLGIEDGMTLVLVPAEQGESFEPQYESLSTGLARSGKNLFAPVTAETAVQTALVIAGLIVATVCALTVGIRVRTDASATALAPGLTGLVLAIGAFSVWRWWPSRSELLSGAAWLALPLLVLGAALAAPGNLGSAHLFIAALVVTVLTAVIDVMTRRHVTVAATIVTLAVVGGLVATARMWSPVPAQWLGMSVLAGLLLLLTLAPTVALRAAGLRPPHFGSITGRDLFSRTDGMPVDAVAPVDDGAEDEASHDTTPRGVVVAEAATRANGVLTGICVASAITLPAAAWVTLMPGQPRGNAAAVLVSLFVLIFIIRGRAFTDRRQAAALVCGAAAAACIAVARYVVKSPAGETGPLLVGTFVLAAFATAGLVAALLVPVTRFTPLVRMVAEWIELAAIVAALPLAVWIGGLFNWVRMR